MKRKVRKPSGLIYFLGKKLVMPFINLRYNVTYQKQELEGPFIMLSNHCGAFDPFYMAALAYPHKINFVAGYKYSQIPFVKFFIKRLGVITKFQYDSSVESAMNILELIRNKQNVGLFPSGRMSSFGDEEIVAPSLAKLIKKAKVNVYIQNIKGNYFTKPKWANNRRKGKINVEIVRILTKEEIEKLNEKELYEIINKYVCFNHFSTKNKQKYRGKRIAEGIENILYKCVNCQKEYFINSNKNTFICGSCHKQWKMNKCYEIDDQKYSNIYKWKEYYMKDIRRLIKNNHKEKQECIIKKYEKGKIKNLGKGVIELSVNGLMFEGVLKKEKTSFVIEKSALISLPFKNNKWFEVIYKNEILMIQLENEKSYIKWDLFVQELYKQKEG